MMNDQNAKADAGKYRPSIVPMRELIKGISAVREYGNQKYKDANSWQRVDRERYVDALGRHTIEFLGDPMSRDEESGLPHLWHIACNVAFLCEMYSEEEHPIKTPSRRLIKDDFLEKYPNAKACEDGRPSFCAELLGYKVECIRNCRDCWNTPLEEVE